MGLLLAYESRIARTRSDCSAVIPRDSSADMEIIIVFLVFEKKFQEVYSPHRQIDKD